MKIYKIAQSQILTGYKIVGFNGQYAYSIYNKNVKIPITLNQTFEDPKGFYLGNSREYCINYFSGGTDDKDLLLTYQYKPENLLKGEPDHKNSEVVINKGILVGVEEVENEF